MLYVVANAKVLIEPDVTNICVIYLVVMTAVSM